MAKTKQEKTKLELDFSKAKPVYTNHIGFMASGEDAELGIGLMDPKENKVHISHRIILTLPHLFRLKDLLNNVTEDILKKIEKSKKTKE